MMKKLLIGAMMAVSVFVFTGCSSESSEAYERLLDIEYVIELLNEAPTMEELEALGLNLINRGERRYNETREINQRIRDRASTSTSRTTGTIWTPHGIQTVDLTTIETRYVPDSELDLHEAVLRMTNVLEANEIPRNVRRNYFNQSINRISFHFATVGDMEIDRLFEISIHGVNYFHGIDFTQFEGISREEILVILNTTYELEAEMLWSPIMSTASTGIVFYYENAQFILRTPETRVMIIEATLLPF